MVYLKYNKHNTDLERIKIMTRKAFDVIVIHPVTNRETRFLNVSQDSLSTNEHGETRFRYNHHHNDVETISVTEVSQARLDAERAYFEKYGTANE